MSASTLANRIREGDATMRAYRARRQKMVAERIEATERSVVERSSEFEERGLAGAERLGELAGRCDAVADLVPREDLQRVRETYEQAAADERIDEALARVEALEREAEQVAEERLRLEVLLETAIAGQDGEVVAGIQWSEDGSLSAVVAFPDQIAMPVTVSGSADSTARIVWHTADSNIASNATAQGTQTACAAELGYVRDIVASCPDMSFEEESLAAAEAMIEEEQDEDADMEEMEAG